MNEQIKDLIRAERQRQIAKWGNPQRSLFEWFVVLQEELGEVAKAILEEGDNEIITELVQVTAVAVQVAEWHPFIKGDNKTEDVIYNTLSNIWQCGSVNTSFLRLCEEVGRFADEIRSDEWDRITYIRVREIISCGAMVILEIMKRQS